VAHEWWAVAHAEAPWRVPDDAFDHEPQDALKLDSLAMYTPSSASIARCVRAAEPRSAVHCHLHDRSRSAGLTHAPASDEPLAPGIPILQARAGFPALQRARIDAASSQAAFSRAPSWWLDRSCSDISAIFQDIIRPCPLEDRLEFF